MMASEKYPPPERSRSESTHLRLTCHAAQSRSHHQKIIAPCIGRRRFQKTDGNNPATTAPHRAQFAASMQIERKGKASERPRTGPFHRDGWRANEPLREEEQRKERRRAAESRKGPRRGARSTPSGWLKLVSSLNGSGHPLYAPSAKPAASRGIAREPSG